jgi:hypothetical protein
MKCSIYRKNESKLLTGPCIGYCDLPTADTPIGEGITTKRIMKTIRGRETVEFRKMKMRDAFSPTALSQLQLIPQH